MDDVSEDGSEEESEEESEERGEGEPQEGNTCKVISIILHHGCLSLISFIYNSLSLSLCLSLTLYMYKYLTLSLSPSIYISHPISLTLSLSLSHPISHPISLSPGGVVRQGHRHPIPLVQDDDGHASLSLQRDIRETQEQPSLGTRHPRGLPRLDGLSLSLFLSLSA